ncbi:hypothetical protein ADUPG1_008955 [Aduncisulcus paluster]|uniref:Uncharacterized protein n=1 Tax=Aduncisulcus paluster TaxID=2918883 RepID=A0ABQ5KXW3_9EUKA|nr:hypothetical protein ADUPG1_008955 [Aduncisulcus paluster]
MASKCSDEKFKFVFPSDDVSKCLGYQFGNPLRSSKKHMIPFSKDKTICLIPSSQRFHPGPPPSATHPPSAMYRPPTQSYVKHQLHPPHILYYTSVPTFSLCPYERSILHELCSRPSPDARSFLNASVSSLPSSKFLAVAKNVLSFKFKEHCRETSLSNSNSQTESKPGTNRIYPQNEGESFCSWFVLLFIRPSYPIDRLIEWSRDTPAQIHKRFSFWRKHGVPQFLRGFLRRYASERGVNAKDINTMLFGELNERKGM